MGSECNFHIQFIVVDEAVATTASVVVSVFIMDCFIVGWFNVLFLCMLGLVEIQLKMLISLHLYNWYLMFATCTVC